MSAAEGSWERAIDPDAGVAYRPLDSEGVGSDGAGGLRIAPSVLRRLAREAFHDIAFFLPRGHLERVAEAAADPGASPEERTVAAALVRNAVVSAEGLLPMCQDTGTAAVFGFKGEGARTGADDAGALSDGIRDAWNGNALRRSQMAPLSMFEEVNTGDNLPAQIELRAVPGAEYRFLFLAKGGGSSNKTVLIQASKAVLHEAGLERLLARRIDELGVAACPPYHIAVVIGGPSPEANLTLVKLAAAGYLDSLPRTGSPGGRPFRDTDWEERVLRIARESGWGAQFGGRHLAAGARVIRLARHAGSCPIGLGVSCSAHRQARAKITAEGVFLEALDRCPGRHLERIGGFRDPEDRVDLNRPVAETIERLRRAGAGRLLRLDGDVVLARDLAHARFGETLRAGGRLPAYLSRYPVYYAGPAETPEGHVIGSLGPTTAQRMDPYVPELLARGASRLMLGKGPRAPAVAEACRVHGGAYFAVIGGAAAWQAREHVAETEVLDFAELGMEAVRRVRLRGLPALLAIDPDGRDAWAARGAAVEYLPDDAVDEDTDRALRRLLTACFTKPRDIVFETRRHFRERYPHRWVIRDGGGAPIAHAGAHEKEIESGGRRYRIGGVCEVCTHPRHRGRGHVRRLLAPLHVFLAERGFAFAVLFGDPRVYGSSGYRPVDNLFHGGGEAGWTRARCMVRELSDTPWPEGEVRLPGPTF